MSLSKFNKRIDALFHVNLMKLWLIEIKLLSKTKYIDRLNHNFYKIILLNIFIVKVRHFINLKQVF